MISIEFTFKCFGINIPPVNKKKLIVKMIPNKKLVKLIDPLKSESLLEIGPGGGALTELLDPYVKDLIGVEVDKKLFNKLCSRNDLANCSFINEDFLKHLSKNATCLLKNNAYL